MKIVSSSCFEAVGIYLYRCEGIMQAIRPFGVPNPGIWRNRPCRCFPENASVEFGPISGDVGKLEKARVFWIGEYAKELKTLTSESGKQYHLQYIACTAQGAFYRATVYDGDTIVETWAVQRIDKVSECTSYDRQSTSMLESVRSMLWTMDKNT